MADDALFPIATPPIQEEIGPLLSHLSWSKAHLGRFLGVSRPQVSRWANGHASPGERAKAAIRFLRLAAATEADSVEADSAEMEDRHRRSRLRQFGEWAHGIGIRGLVFARLGASPERGFRDEEDSSSPLLAPREIYEIRQALGWIQAEMAAFFGITHSTPAKWEDLKMDDPRISPATEAELIALRAHATHPSSEEQAVRDLWQEGVSHFMTETVGWEAGILLGKYSLSPPAK